jgi:hypothetical protein
MSENSAREDEILTREQRRKLRLATLRFARLFPPGPERNELRQIAQSLAFFEDVTVSDHRGESPWALPRHVAHVELMRRW